MKGRALPFLEPIETAHEAALAAKRLNNLPTSIAQRAVAYLFAVSGEVPQAVRELDAFLDATANDPHGWFQADRSEATNLRKQLLSDPILAQQQLREWEAQTRTALDLDAYR